MTTRLTSRRTKLVRQSRHLSHPRGSPSAVVVVSSAVLLGDNEFVRKPIMLWSNRINDRQPIDLTDVPRREFDLPPNSMRSGC